MNLLTIQAGRRTKRGAMALISVRFEAGKIGIEGDLRLLSSIVKIDTGVV